MRITLRPAGERGHADHGWLKTLHSFSFARYYHETHMGFRALRVINEDIVEPRRGFGTHPHDNMEIISYVISGTLRHRDSMGNESELPRGGVQHMTAGSGITHSEFNPSNEPMHMLQIWLIPEKRQLEPHWEERVFAATEKRGKLKLLVSPDAREDSLPIHQDVDLYASILEKEEEIKYEIRPGRALWLQLVSGSLQILNGKGTPAALQAGDGASVEPGDVDASTQITIIGREQNTEFLLFDLGPFPGTA